MSRRAARRGRGAAFFLTPLGIVFTTVLIDLIGFGIVIPLMPLYAERFGASPTVIGLLTASYAIAQLIFAPVWGRLSDRIGRRPVILASLLGSCVAALTFGLAEALWLLFVARILDGISGASYAAAQAYVADVTSPEERSRGMGLIGAAFGLGFIIGPAIGALASIADPRLPFFIASALAATNLAIAWRRLPESLPRGARPERPSPIAALTRALGRRSIAPLLAITFAANLAFIGMESTFALFGARRFDFGLAETGAVFTYIGVVAAVSQGALVHRLVARYGEWRVMQTGLMLTAVALGLLSVTTRLWALFPVLLLLAGGSGLVFPTATSLLSRAVDPADQGAMLGAMAGVGGAARVIAPIAATVVFQQVGVGAPFLAGAVMFAACWALAMLVRERPVLTGRPPPATAAGGTSGPVD
jgi:multidrug resistance protein